MFLGLWELCEFEPRTVNGGTGSDWADFEAAGCVFLPAAGYREDYVYDAGSFCSYWSSTAADIGHAYYLKINPNSGYMYTSLYANRYSGKSVRLVRPVE